MNSLTWDVNCIVVGEAGSASYTSGVVGVPGIFGIVESCIILRGKSYGRISGLPRVGTIVSSDSWLDGIERNSMIGGENIECAVTEFGVDGFETIACY